MYYTCTTCIIQQMYGLQYKTRYVLTVQNPRHKCDWEKRMTTDKKIIADYTRL